MFKDSPQGQTNYYVSKCCHAHITTHEIDIADPPLNYYAKCQKCGKICDIIPASENYSKCCHAQVGIRMALGGDGVYDDYCMECGQLCNVISK